MAHPPDRALSRAITDVLQQARQRGMTQKDLADYFGVSDATISRWEAGGRQPALDLLPAFDKLAGQERGYVLRRAGYVGDDASGNVNFDNDDESELWGLRMPEWVRWEFIKRLREINAEPPPPAKKAPARRRRGA
jgi:transcriptional regulator with XRE-family HTH domain